MKTYIEEKPVFSDSIQLTETTDPGNADYMNIATKQIFANTLVNKKEVQEGDSKNRTITFESKDSENANKWTNVAVPESGEEHKSLMEKISIMFKNVRYLHKLLGTTDISKIGDGTVTGAIKKVNKALKPIDAENRIEEMTSINQITSIGFWKIADIENNYAREIGIDNNVGDFYAVVSNYNGNGIDFYNFGDLLLFSPRLQGYHYAINIWNGNAQARFVLTNNNILTTKEQINANTDLRNVAGATAMKEMFGEINSNLTTVKQVGFVAQSENAENSSCLIEYIELPNNVLLSITGAIKIRKALKHSDILGTFNLPFSIDVSFSAYIDRAVTNEIQHMVVATLRPNGNLITRTPLFAENWIGFLGCTLIHKVNN